MMPTDPIHSERQLYQLWERHALPGAAFSGVKGERIVVISSGRRNVSAGPDYLGAVLLIDGELRCGAVEMHLSEADWFTHGHQRDPAYMQVILHLLAEPPISQQLPLTTIAAADIIQLPDRDEVPLPVASLDVAADLLADLSWGRLLRRVTEIVRSGAGIDPVTHLRRTFVLRLFDCLGYSHNRLPMRRVAERLLENESLLYEASFDTTVELIVRLSGISPERFADAGRTCMSASLLESIHPITPLPDHAAAWRFDTRPANAPERRLWGAARLTFEVYHSRLLGRLLECMMGQGGSDAMLRLVMCRLGEQQFIGAGRASEIVLNALIPVALTAGIMLPHARLLESACRTYRNWPSTGSNGIVRSVERRYLAGRRLRGAFWQQGAIEFHQRYLSPDRRGLSMIAEPEERRSQKLEVRSQKLTVSR